MKVTRRAFAASAWAVSRCRGQEPVFRAETRLVVIDAQVVERRTGRVIEILTREDFVIEDEGEPQEIKVFDFGLTPLDLVLLIDVSGSMLDVSRTMAQALRQAVRELDAMDRVALIVFSNRAKVVLPLTESRTELQSGLEDALRMVTRRESGTRLYDALAQAARLLQAEGKPVAHRRRAVLAVTNDQESKSKATLEEIIRRCSKQVLPSMRSYSTPLIVEFPRSLLAPRRFRGFLPSRSTGNFRGGNRFIYRWSELFRRRAGS